MAELKKETPRERVSARLSSKELEQIKKYGETPTKQLHEALERLEYLEDFFTIQTESYDVENHCDRRLIKNKEFYCIQTNYKGLNAQKKMLSVDVCRICKIHRYNISQAAAATPEKIIPEQVQEKSLLCPQSGEPFQADPYCIQCQKNAQVIWFRCEARKYWRKTGKLTVKA